MNSTGPVSPCCTASGLPYSTRYPQSALINCLSLKDHRVYILTWPFCRIVLCDLLSQTNHLSSIPQRPVSDGLFKVNYSHREYRLVRLRRLVACESHLGIGAQHHRSLGLSVSRSLGDGSPRCRPPTDRSADASISAPLGVRPTYKCHCAC